MTRRSHIPYKEQLAAALLQIPAEGGGRAIPHDHAKQMTADQVISLFNRDHHPIRKEDGGPDLHWNLTWRFIGDHRLKTAKTDRPQSAKGIRIRRDEAEHKLRMAQKWLAPSERKEPTFQRPRHRIRSRGFPKQQRPNRRKAS